MGAADCTWAQYRQCGIRENVALIAWLNLYIAHRNGCISRRPTGCALAAASADTDLQNANDRVREAVGCTGMLDGGQRLRSVQIHAVGILDVPANAGDQ